MEIAQKLEIAFQLYPSKMEIAQKLEIAKFSNLKSPNEQIKSKISNFKIQMSKKWIL